MTWKRAAELPPPEQREHGAVILAHYGYGRAVPTVLVWRSDGNFSGWIGADNHKHMEPTWWMPAPPPPADDRPLCTYCNGSGSLEHRQRLHAGTIQEHWHELPNRPCDFCGGSGRVRT